MSKVESGNTVSVHYRGTLSSGEEFDSSFDRKEALTFQVGEGQMIPGFDRAVIGMQVGETKKVTIPSNEAYGAHNPQAVQEVSKESFPADFDFTEGVTVQGTNPAGEPIIGTILGESNDKIMLDFNHPMAGHELNFEIKLVTIKG